MAIASPRRVLRFVASGLLLLSVARILVLLIESYVQVRNERQEDEDLILACASGVASQSADFRALCLKKRAERSSPVVLKAVLRAVTTCFADFCESMSSPVKVVMLLLFALTGIAAPVIKACSQLVVESVRERRRGRLRSVDDLGSGSDDDDVPEIAVLSSRESFPHSPGVMRVAHRFRKRLAHYRADRIAPMNVVCEDEQLPIPQWDGFSDLFHTSQNAILNGRPMPPADERRARTLRIR